jgi:hypothetical protein
LDNGGVLKVCKVAGTGVAVGTSFTFTANSSTFSVPAGPAPSGTCVVGPTFPVGANVAVAETVPVGDTVSSITVVPAGQIVGTPNLATGSVNVTIGSGVTEVTYTDNRIGFLEICKRSASRFLAGSFTFSVNALGPFVVPAGSCSPAIEVPAGSVDIHEVPTRGASMVACATIPASQQGPCNLGTQTSTVTVTPGDVSAQTIAFITNLARFGRAILGDTATTVSCAPNPAPVRGAVTCTAKVTAVPPGTGAPTGTVSFIEGDTTLATVQLSIDGTAAFTISTLLTGTHAIVAAYGGDTDFDQSVSQQFTQRSSSRELR